MGSIKINDKQFELLISSERIECAVRELAGRISADYGSRQRPLLMLVTLSGAMMFAAELSKHLSVDVEWAFVKCGSYGGGMRSSGSVCFEIEPTADLASRDVLVVEDVVDSGVTWQALHDYIMPLAPSSLKIATLTFKPSAYQKQLVVDYVAIETQNKFLIGYGLDYQQRGRALNGIYEVTSC